MARGLCSPFDVVHERLVVRVDDESLPRLGDLVHKLEEAIFVDPEGRGSSEGGEGK